MSLRRTVVVILFATGALYWAISAFRSYELYRYYTDIEQDFSVAESYEVELSLKLPLAALCLGVTAIAARPLFRRSAAKPEEPNKAP